jgi:hypothetical protein
MGVGTVTIKKLASLSASASSVRRRFVLRNAASVTSRVVSLACRKAATRCCEMSKPMTGSNFFAKARATGNPT